MYTEFYGLVERPFELTPDQRYLYLSAHHREALAHLTYGVEERKGFVQLTGEVGTGKTTMLDALVVGLDASTKVARLAHTTIDEIDLLRVLARGFGLELHGVTKSDMLAEIGATLEARTKEGRNAVFIVDEAQNLSLTVLEEIRLLSNLRATGRSSLQIVLAGQPELRAKLERRELRQLRQRIGIRYHLTPLSREETGEYVDHRLTVAGATRKIFEKGAVQAIYEYSRGVPRVINTLCDRALLAGYAEGRETVNRELILATIEAIEGRAPAVGPTLVTVKREPEPAPPPSRSRPRFLPAVALVAALIVTAVFVWLRFGWGPAPAGPVDEEVREVVVAEPPVADGTAGAEDVRTPGARAGADAAEGAASDEPPSRLGEGADVKPDAVREAPPPVDVAGSQAPAERAAGAPAAAETGESERAESPIARGPYAVVVLSLRSDAAARDAADELIQIGYAASVERADIPDKGIWFRVVLAEGYSSAAEARAVAARMAEVGYDDAWVLKR